MNFNQNTNPDYTPYFRGIIGLLFALLLLTGFWFLQWSRTAAATPQHLSASLDQ